MGGGPRGSSRGYRGSGRQNTGRGAQTNSSKTCYYCGKLGHIQSECRKMKSDAAGGRGTARGATCGAARGPARGGANRGARRGQIAVNNYGTENDDLSVEASEDDEYTEGM